MREIESVDIREFRANLHTYTAKKDTPIIVTSHGEPIGYYLPVRPAARERAFDALRNASRQISEMLLQSGVGEDEIIADFQKARRHARES